MRRLGTLMLRGDQEGGLGRWNDEEVMGESGFGTECSTYQVDGAIQDGTVVINEEIELVDSVRFVECRPSCLLCEIRSSSFDNSQALQSHSGSIASRARCSKAVVLSLYI